MANPAKQTDESDAVFATAAELFSLLSTPIRLKIISALCHGEKNVSQLLAEIDTTQPNMSQHLSTLYRAGVLGKRRDATQIYYRIESERAAMLCRAVCTQIAFELDAEDDVPDNMVNFIELNADLAKTWPVITERKDAPADAKEWDGRPDKLGLLER